MAEAFPHAAQTLQQKYAFLNTLILERSKIDATIVMVQQDIGKVITSSATFVPDYEPTGASGPNRDQEKPASKDSAKVNKKPTSKKKNADPPPIPEPQPESNDMPLKDQLRDLMAALSKAGKGKEAMAELTKISKTPGDASEEEMQQMLPALKALLNNG